MQDTSKDQEPLKDPDSSHPVAVAWRPTLREIVKALAEGDYALAAGVHSVAPVRPAVAHQMQAYIRKYGETLTALPDEAWQTSISQWMGTYWDLLVDLWTVQSGRSDLVLGVRVFEHEGGFRFEIDSVRVP